MTFLTKEEEESLLKQFIDKKDITARNKLIEDQIPAIKAIAFKLNRDPNIREELVNEAVVELSRKLHKFDRHVGIRLCVWVRVVARNAMLNYFNYGVDIYNKSDKDQASDDSQDGFDMSKIVDDAALTLDELVQSDLIGRLTPTLKALTNIEKLALKAFLFEGNMKALAIDQQVTKTYLYACKDRAVEKLRRRI